MEENGIMEEAEVIETTLKPVNEEVIDIQYTLRVYWISSSTSLPKLHCCRH